MSKIVVPFDEQLSAHRNKTGFRGVDEAKPGRFRAVLKRNKTTRSKYYSTAAAAAQAYDILAKKTYGDRAYLNFPSEGERKVSTIEDGFCKRGHARDTNTYHSPNGKKNCRKCNALAQARRRARCDQAARD